MVGNRTDDLTLRRDASDRISACYNQGRYSILYHLIGGVLKRSTSTNRNHTSTFAVQNCLNAFTRLALIGEGHEQQV